ncbi:MAG: hypothetical protein GY795_21135 [Desulfobacterales bacterium]|nr:hypothetical protein [Desulfobacterales bacterium]
MNQVKQLTLEVLSGPLDGAFISLDGDAHWNKTGNEPLAFPWDTELGQPQANFIYEEDGWYLEGMNALHGTYRINREEKINKKVKLERDDILKASNTWLRVEKV